MRKFPALTVPDDLPPMEGSVSHVLFVLIALKDKGYLDHDLSSRAGLALDVADFAAHQSLTKPNIPH